MASTLSKRESPGAASSASPPPSKARRASAASGNGNLTNYQRKLICEFYRKSGGVMSQKDLAQWTKHEFNLKKTPAHSLDDLMRETDKYALRDVFAVDETPVLYTMPPLTHVVVFLLTPAVMQMLNPITSRVVLTFKKRFRRYHLRYAMNRADKKSAMFDVDVLQAMKWAVASWDEISSDTIKRAWVPTQLVRTRVELDDHDLLHDEEETLLDTELDHLMLFLRLANPIPMIEYLNDETLSDYPVHEDKFDVVSNVCEVDEDEVDDTMDESPSQTLSLQEKLKAFRDVLHVLKDRNDADDSALNAIRRVQDAIRLEGQKEAMQALSHTQGDTKHLYDWTSPADRTCTTPSVPSLDVETAQKMDTSSLLDPSENSALSAASASLAEGATDHTVSGIMDDATDHEARTHMESGFHAVI
ncbi:hypothetical protein PsorP6_014545 [Peronosclerospora sorghi]|uniref:Uncharacterized protein n=1 Tax=Peronosclerospora sorghi TaxID=230839 RepID=A0ACC0VTK4_9STRA|nr:hypothetical protein PsorP6_014545 [Peronosclerospora sorghi]